MKNDFELDTQPKKKQDFLKRIRIWIGVAILLTGVMVIAGIYYTVEMLFVKGIGNQEIASFASREVYYLVILIAFALLIKILIDEKPFSSTLTKGIQFSGLLFVAASIVIPRLGGYQSSGFEISSYGSFVLIDGMFLLPGLLLIVLGRIIMAGFVMQKELDEIL